MSVRGGDLERAAHVFMRRLSVESSRSPRPRIARRAVAWAASGRLGGGRERKSGRVYTPGPSGPQRTVAELKELRALTGDDHGAQRVAFTPLGVTTRAGLAQKFAGRPVETHADEAGDFGARCGARVRGRGRSAGTGRTEHR